MPDLFTHAGIVTGQQLRAEGMRRVSEHAGRWVERAHGYLLRLPQGWVGTGEDIRLAARHVIGEPHDPNAWSALIGTAVGKRWLKATGDYVVPKDPKSHARKIQLYVKLS